MDKPKPQNNNYFAKFNGIMRFAKREALVSG